MFARNAWIVVGATLAIVAAAVFLVGRPTPATGPFIYTKSEGAWLTRRDSRYSALEPFVREIWIAADGSGRIREMRGAPEFFGELDRAEWRGVQAIGDSDRTFGPGQLTYLDSGPLPTSPEALSAFLMGQAAQAGGPIEAEMFMIVRSYLHENVVPPATGRALLSALVAPPGVVASAANDPLGRPGTLVAVTGGSPAVRHEMIISSEGRLLSETETLLEVSPQVDSAPPAVIGYATYLDAHIEDTP